MPPVTRWFIKSAMVYFVLGVILAFISELPGLHASSLLLPVYWHMLVIGWITQVIMGVSIWMFPRKRHNRKKIQSANAVLAFFTLNTGLVLRFFAEPFIPFFKDQTGLFFVIAISSILQICGVLFFLFEIWPRVQPKIKPGTE